MVERKILGRGGAGPPRSFPGSHRGSSRVYRIDFRSRCSFRDQYSELSRGKQPDLTFWTETSSRPCRGAGSSFGDLKVTV